ncbi:hypothetical protein EV175_000181 [Coemansia sp. RSA 1933]|nr:hypothetical protein EV175_000181 [Coemansia sp. RSA 1933]
MSLLSASANAVGLVLFAQSTWISGWQLIRRDALVAPEAPAASSQAVTKDKPLHPSNQDLPASPGHLEIAKAVHPHLYKEPPATPEETCSALSRKLKRVACGFDCDRVAHTAGYLHTVPYLSTQLAFAQALVGLVVTAVTMAWQLRGSPGCPAVALVVAFHVGLTLLFVASAVQTHLVNALCIKIFVIVGVALGAHFSMLGLMLGNALVSQDLCAIEQPAGWLANLPAYTAVAHFFVFFFSAISFINGGFRLSTKTKDFLSFREIVYVFLVYRGIGLLFATNIAGLLLSTVSGILAAVRMFQFMPLWIIQWSVVSRIHVLALRHRATTDAVAHQDAFWDSLEYAASHSRLPEPLGPGDGTLMVGGLVPPAGKRAFLTTVAKLLFTRPRCKKQCCADNAFLYTTGRSSRRVESGPYQPLFRQTESISPQSRDSIDHLSIVVDNYATRASRHDTVVEDDVRF